MAKYRIGSGSGVHKNCGGGMHNYRGGLLAEFTAAARGAIGGSCDGGDVKDRAGIGGRS